MISRDKLPHVRINGGLCADYYTNQVFQCVVQLVTFPLHCWCMEMCHPTELCHQAFSGEPQFDNIRIADIINDMNNIENIWTQNMWLFPDFSLNSDALFETVYAIWDEMTDDYIGNQMTSMCRRVRTFHNATIAHTKH